MPLHLPSAAELLVPAACAGGLFFSTLLFLFLWVRGREKLHLNMVLLGFLGFIYVASELMVLVLGSWQGRVAIGREFHRLEQVVGAWFLVALPMLVAQILNLPRVIFRFNRILIFGGIAVATVVTGVAYVFPDVFISQAHPTATALIHASDYARGREGWLYQLRDISLGVLLIYSVVLLVFFAKRQQQLHFRLPVFLSLLVAFWTGVDDILFVYLRFHIDPLHDLQFSRFSMGATAVVFASMLSTHLKFLQQGRELKEANTSLDRLLAQTEEQLYRDPLTGIPNRLCLTRDLEKNDSCHLILGNLNRFGDTNDFYGMTVGDILIRALSRRLEDFARERGLDLYKFRGDEFALKVPGNLTSGAVEQLARDLHRRVTHTPYRYDEHRIELQLAIGIGLGPGRVQEKAESALFQAKKRHQAYAVSDSVSGFDKDWSANLRRAKQVRDAIRDERVKVWYQPIHDNRTRRIAKAEALVRLHETDGTILSPGEFLTTARRSSLYGGVSREVIRQVFDKIPQTPLEISVNVSAEDLEDPDTLTHIYQGLEREGADRLVFEILETEGMGDYRAVTDFIARVKGRGCRVAIDDFGTGYSTFQHLLRLKVDFIKIDGSLIRNLDTDENSRILVGNIVDFSNKLGMLTVAEYVHSAPVQKAVVDLGVTYSQGYFFGAPAQDLDVAAS